MTERFRKIPLCAPTLGPEEIQAVAAVLESGWLAHGPKNQEFERLACEFLGVAHAVSTNSCTSALWAALRALAITGEVLAPSFTFVATVNAIILAGATPVFVDVDESGNICPDEITKAITPATQAIMVVHYAGLPANMPAIIALAKRHGLRIIEDSAECFGGSYHGAQAGVHDVGCFSFFPTKNITTGEGGLLVTNDGSVAQRARQLCAHGIDSSTFEREKAMKPWLRIASQPGFNFRLSHPLAAMGVEQMKKAHGFASARRRLATRYLERLADVPAVRCPETPEGFVHSWQMFTIQVSQERRNHLLAFLRSSGIEASVHFEPPVHEQPPFACFRRTGTLERTERLARSIVTLPLFPGLELTDVDFVCDAVEAFFS